MTKLVQAKIALDIANGMNFLHQSGILHRDLKPDNVLVLSSHSCVSLSPPLIEAAYTPVQITSLSGKADINAKLTDFGTSRAVGAGSEEYTFTKGLGTVIFSFPLFLCDLKCFVLYLLLQPIYMAPEILGHHDYSEKADVFSFAILLWVLVAGKEPYTDFKNSWGHIQHHYSSCCFPLNYVSTHCRYCPLCDVREETRNSTQGGCSDGPLDQD